MRPSLSIPSSLLPARLWCTCVCVCVWAGRQSDVDARKTLLRLSEAAWADALVEMALCERDLDEPFAALGGAGAGSSGDAVVASSKVSIAQRNGSEGNTT